MRVSNRVFQALLWVTLLASASRAQVPPGDIPGLPPNGLVVAEGDAPYGEVLEMGNEGNEGVASFPLSEAFPNGIALGPIANERPADRTQLSVYSAGLVTINNGVPALFPASFELLEAGGYLRRAQASGVRQLKINPVVDGQMVGAFSQIVDPSHDYIAPMWMEADINCEGQTADGPINTVYKRIIPGAVGHWPTLIITWFDIRPPQWLWRDRQHGAVDHRGQHGHTAACWGEATGGDSVSLRHDGLQLDQPQRGRSRACPHRLGVLLGWPRRWPHLA